MIAGRLTSMSSNVVHVVFLLALMCPIHAGKHEEPGKREPAILRAPIKESLDQFISRKGCVLVLLLPESEFSDHIRSKFFAAVQDIGHSPLISFAIAPLGTERSKVESITSDKRFRKFLSRKNLNVPHILAWRDGRPVPFTASSDSALVPWIERFISPASFEIDSVVEWETWLSRNRPSIVGYFVTEDESPGSKVFNRLSGSDPLHSEVFFAFSRHPEVLEHTAKGERHAIQFYQKAEAIREDCIVLYRDYGPPIQLYGSDINEKNVSMLILEDAHNLVREVDKYTFGDLVAEGLPIVLLFVDSTTHANVKERFRKTASKFRKLLNFAVNERDTDSDYQMQAFGVKDVQYPAITLVDLHIEKQLHYVFDLEKEITKQALSDWCIQFLEKKLKPSMQSEPTPKERTRDNPVQVVSYDTFEDMINMQKQKLPIVISFHVPEELDKWKKTKRFLKIWKSIAESLYDEAIIASYDLSKNDQPTNHHHFEEYPCIRMFYAGLPAEKPYVELPSDKVSFQKEAIADWIRGHASALKRNHHHHEEL